MPPRNEPATTTAQSPTEVLNAREVALKPYSDGMFWDPERVAMEVLQHTESIVHSAYEIGRRLIWAKAELKHGKFEHWLEGFAPFSIRSAQHYMQLAEYIVENPKLREPMARGGLKKALLLTTLAPDQVERLVGDGNCPEADIPDLETVSYHELKQQVEKLKADKLSAALTADDTEKRLLEAKAEIADLTGMSRTKDDKKIRARVAEYYEQLDQALAMVGLLVDHLAPNWDGLSLETKAQVYGLLDYAQRRAELEGLHFRESIGEATVGQEWIDIIEAPRPAASHFPLPEYRTVGRAPGSADAK